MTAEATVLGTFLLVLGVWLVIPPSHPTEALISQNMWRSVQVANWRLAFGNITQKETSSIIKCAQVANENPWSFLFCYHQDNNTCSIRSLKVPATFEDNHTDVTICHTRLSKDYDVCEPPFTSVSNLGCVYGIADPKLSWEDARRHCQVHYHADLVVPEVGSFTHLMTFLQTTDLGWTWGGMRARQWLDGRRVSNSEWYSGQPNSVVDTCGEMYYTKGIGDYTCTTLYSFICEISTD